MTFSVETATAITTAIYLAETTFSDGEIVDAATYDSLQDIAVQTSNETASDPNDETILVVMGGDAAAVGTDTYAVGAFTGTIDADGILTIASGDGFSGAEAFSDDADAAYAAATSYAYVIGADHVVTISHSGYVTTSDLSGSTAVATAEMSFLALETNPNPSYTTAEISGGDDVESDGPESSETSSGPLTISASFEVTGLPDWVEGNIASVEVHAEVFAEATFIMVDAELLTVEDSLSFLTVNMSLGYG